MTRCLEVVRAGALTTVQDRGRAGLAHLAVPHAGALDEPAHRLANRLVGNGPDAATLETTLSGLVVRPQVDCHLAVTGAPAAVRVAGRPVGFALPILAGAGQVVEVDAPVRGVRCYLAVAGGIAVEPVLGSRSTDLLSGLGPAVLRDGDQLPLGAAGGDPARVDFVPYPAPPDELRLPLDLGPRDDWVTPAALDALRGSTYRVSPDSNRVGLRLDGPPLRRRDAAELESEGVVIGAVQVPPDGKPIIFLADHPTTGGYPVVGVVTPDAVWACAPARPGTPVRFLPRRPAPW